MLNGHTPTFCRDEPGASATHTACTQIQQSTVQKYDFPAYWIGKTYILY